MAHCMTEEMIRWFGNELEAEEKSRATIEKYLRDVRGFYAYAKSVTGQDEAPVDKALAVSYKEALLERYAVSSVNSMLAALNHFLKKMQWHDCTVKALKVQRAAFRESARCLSRKEYLRLLDAASRGRDRKLYLVMQALCSTGIRVSELRFITVEALNRRMVTVSIKGKTRTVILPAALCRELRVYVRHAGIRSGSIFVTRSGKPLDRSNIGHKMKALSGRAGVAREKIFPHNLRHLFACMYYDRAKDLSHLADLLGHSNINTTRIYTLVSVEEEARQIEKLGLVV